MFTGAPFAAIGGIGALWLRDIPFSVSAGVGFVEEKLAALTSVRDKLRLALSRCRAGECTIVEKVLRLFGRPRLEQPTSARVRAAELLSGSSMAFEERSHDRGEQVA